LGRVTSDTIVLTGGVEMISSGGVDSQSFALGTIVSGGTVDVLSGGEFDLGTVSSGGVLNVFGTTNSTNSISSGGVENVWSGGLVSGATDSGTILAGGTLNVFSGGTAAFVEIGIGLLSGSLSAPTLDLVQSQSADESTGVVAVGAVSISAISPPPFSVTWVGGTLNVSQGGLAHDIGVGPSGFLNVLGSATSNINVVSGGTVNVSSGGVLDSTPHSSGAFGFGAANASSGAALGEANFSVTVSTIPPSAVLSGGTLNVLTGGRAVDTVISSGGVENVAGQTAIDIVSSGGNLFMLSGGQGSVVTVSAGGSATVLSGGSLSGESNPAAGGGGGSSPIAARSRSRNSRSATMS
jgi:autotransporter passenger strand-loop-strand repeat protein